MTPLGELLADHQPYHSEFQIDHLIVVRSGGTLFGCYKQVLRELWKRWRGLRDLHRQCPAHGPPERLADDHSLSWSREAMDPAGRGEPDAEVWLNLADTEREFLRFYALGVALKERIGPLTPERRACLEEELWEHRVKCHSAVDFISQGRLSSSTVELLQACPIPLRRRLVDLVLDPRRHAELIDWYLAYDPQLPPPAPLDRRDVARLLAETRPPSLAAGSGGSPGGSPRRIPEPASGW